MKDIRSRSQLHDRLRGALPVGSQLPLYAGAGLVPIARGESCKDVRGTPCGVTRRKCREANARTAEASSRRRTGGSRVAWATRFGVDRDKGLVVLKTNLVGCRCRSNGPGSPPLASHAERARDLASAALERVTTVSREQSTIFSLKRIGGAARASSRAKPVPLCGPRPLDASASS